ncbi:hypothetical protein [Parafilimonas sp.]|uniref:hypothetical protein n=1 Tax=Parafilimonas sp. TaxID=1969739 RepID=UPI0039E42D1E
MTNLQKSLQREIACFTEAISSEGGSIPEVSKAAFCKARKKLKPEAFKELSEIALNVFYKNASEVQRWHGFRLLATDGSTVELPNSKAIQADYDVFKTRSDGKAICMGRTLSIYDPLNHTTLYGALAAMAESEPPCFGRPCPIWL